LRMGTAATTFQTGLERRLPVPVRRARMKGLQAPLQACSALHSPAGSDRPAGFFRCLAAPAGRARMNTGGSVHRPCRLESPPRPVAPRRGFSFAALRDRLARQVAVLDILPDAERWRRMSTRSAVLNSRCSQTPSSCPAGKLAGFFVKCLVIRPLWLEPAHQLRCHRKPR
jgi:hypothetical protein